MFVSLCSSFEISEQFSATFKKINNISVVAVMILGGGISRKENALFDLNVLFIINGMAF